MWARIAEMGLAAWLAASPWVFTHPRDALWLWANDLFCAVLIFLWAWLPFHRPLERFVRFLQIATALWLIGCALLQDAQPTPPAAQNHMVTGLVLLMFAVIPSQSQTPPVSWIRFYQDGLPACPAGSSKARSCS